MSEIKTSSYVEWLKSNVSNGAVRSAISRSDNSRFIHLAYPYLSRFWVDTEGQALSWKQESITTHASLVSRSRVKNDDTTSFGKLAQRLSKSGAISEDSLNMMVNLMYRSNLAQARKTMEAILTLAEGVGIRVNYQLLYDSCRWWDFKPYANHSQRRRMLDDYYGFPVKKKEEPQEAAKSSVKTGE